MEQDHGEDVETVLAQHMLRLFKHHDLTGAQAKSLLEKVRLRLDAGEIGLQPGALTGESVRTRSA